MKKYWKSKIKKAAICKIIKTVIKLGMEKVLEHLNRSMQNYLNRYESTGTVTTTRNVQMYWNMHTQSQRLIKFSRQTHQLNRQRSTENITGISELIRITFGITSGVKNRQQISHGLVTSNIYGTDQISRNEELKPKAKKARSQ